MKPVRVLHLITRLIVGGAQENTMLTASLLDRKRFEVEILSGPQTGSEGSLIEEVRGRGIPLTILPELVRQVSPLNDRAALAELTRFIKEGRYNIVHTHSSKAGILGRMAARRAKVPVVVHTIHGWSFHEYLSPVKRWLYAQSERMTAPMADALIVVAESDIQKGLKEKIGQADQYCLIRSAIPVEEYLPSELERKSARDELNIPPEVQVIGNVGRFSAQKNPLEWISIAGMVARQYPEAYFLLVGDGPMRRQVEKLLEIEGIGERTMLTGLRRDVPRMLAAMDIFMMTSLWEGLPRVVPQAMCMELPIVANQIDGLKEAIQPGETGYLCSVKELAEMAIFCGYLIDNPSVRREMGQKSRQFALQEFDLKRMISQIEDLYERLLSFVGISV
jgi:glycosyltransferase involved in cell wall biosynthesis